MFDTTTIFRGLRLTLSEDRSTIRRAGSAEAPTVTYKISVTNPLSHAVPVIALSAPPSGGAPAPFFAFAINASVSIGGAPGSYAQVFRYDNSDPPPGQSKEVLSLAPGQTLTTRLAVTKSNSGPVFHEFGSYEANVGVFADPNGAVGVDGSAGPIDVDVVPSD